MEFKRKRQHSNNIWKESLKNIDNKYEIREFTQKQRIENIVLYKCINNNKKNSAINLENFL